MFRDRIGEIKTRALSLLEEAAQDGNANKIVVLAKIIEENEKMLKRFEQIENDLTLLEKNLENVGTVKSNCVGTIQPTNKWNEHKKSTQAVRRENADRARSILLRQLSDEGITLHRAKGVIFGTNSAVKIALPFATEDQKGDHWFLGLPDKREQYDLIVLICQKETNELINFVLSPYLLDQIWDKLSRSHINTRNPSVKFNVCRRDNKYLLMIPNSDPIVINNSIDNFDCIK